MSYILSIMIDQFIYCLPLYVFLCASGFKVCSKIEHSSTFSQRGSRRNPIITWVKPVDGRRFNESRARCRRACNVLFFSLGTIHCRRQAPKTARARSIWLAYIRFYPTFFHYPRTRRRPFSAIFLKRGVLPVKLCRSDGNRVTLRGRLFIGETSSRKESRAR